MRRGLLFIARILIAATSLPDSGANTWKKLILISGELDLTLFSTGFWSLSKKRKAAFLCYALPGDVLPTPASIFLNKASSIPLALSPPAEM
jgi:hypothetical protein